MPETRGTRVSDAIFKDSVCLRPNLRCLELQDRRVVVISASSLASPRVRRVTSCRCRHLLLRLSSQGPCLDCLPVKKKRGAGRPGTENPVVPSDSLRHDRG